MRCSSLDLATAVTTRALAERSIDPAIVDELVLGMTIAKHGSFFGPRRLAARIGPTSATGPMIAQAWATGVAALHAAAPTAQCRGGLERWPTKYRVLYRPPRDHSAAGAAGVWSRRRSAEAALDLRGSAPQEAGTWGVVPDSTVSTDRCVRAPSWHRRPARCVGYWQGPKFNVLF
jgi:hypothetical protein